MERKPFELHVDLPSFQEESPQTLIRQLTFQQNDLRQLCRDAFGLLPQI